ncbi:TPA: primase C-terminal domain-containing protein [Klebsiella pneumoniae]|nr:primase C-terminal domain-containing protein [Klebsiella pneumoniae]HED2371072.1 primase C-terminal domain-containing protein [Klebsiella pneumoniae]
MRQGWLEYDQWLQACYERASAYNLQFAAPLDENKVDGIAKSIAKWTISKFSEDQFMDFVKATHTPEIQSKRGKKAG